MFTEEVGVDPRAGDGGAGYRARVAELVDGSRVRPVRGRRGGVQGRDRRAVARVGQIQGVWVHPAYRGRGLGTAGTAAVAERARAMGRTSSLYVNAFNTPARAAYAIGFTQVASFATVLF